MIPRYLFKNISSVNKIKETELIFNKFIHHATAAEEIIKPFEEIPGPKTLPIIGTILPYKIGEFVVEINLLSVNNTLSEISANNYFIQFILTL